MKRMRVAHECAFNGLHCDILPIIFVLIQTVFTNLIAHNSNVNSDDSDTVRQTENSYLSREHGYCSTCNVGYSMQPKTYKIHKLFSNSGIHC